MAAKAQHANATGALIRRRQINLVGSPRLQDFALTGHHVLLFDSPVRFHLTDAMRATAFRAFGRPRTCDALLNMTSSGHRHFATPSRGDVPGETVASRPR